MKTPLAARIEAHLTRSGLSQKELASRLQERWPKAQLTTLQEKLSKLRSGREEGEKLLDKPEVAEGLAVELQETVERLQFLRGLPKLVLHPNVPATAEEYLRRRAEELYDTSDWIITVAVDPDPDGRSADVLTMKAVAEAASGLGRHVLVIANAGTLEDADERTLYEVAKLDLAFLAKHARGHEIVDRPDVLPLRNPEPPKLEDSEGQRLYQVSKMAAEAREAWDCIDGHQNPYEPPFEWDRFETILSGSAPAYRWRANSPGMQRVSAILKREEIPTFYAEQVLRWAGRRHDVTPRAMQAGAPKFLDLISDDVAVDWHIQSPPDRTTYPYREKEEAARPPPDHELVANAVDQCRFGKTTIWHHEGRWFVVGDAAGQIRESLHEHCPTLELVEPEFSSELARLLRERRNPWVKDPEWLAELSRRTAAECGLQVDSALLKVWRNEAMLRAAEAYRYYRFASADPTAASVLRRQLTSLLTRDVVLSEPSAWSYFVLQAAIDAPLLAASASLGDAESNAIVNLGAGHLIRLRITEYPVERASALRMLEDREVATFCGRYAATETHLDGGDLHVQIATLPDVPLLEAGLSSATRRRQQDEAAEEAERASYSDDDDD